MRVGQSWSGVGAVAVCALLRGAEDARPPPHARRPSNAPKNRGSRHHKQRSRSQRLPQTGRMGCAVRGERRRRGGRGGEGRLLQSQARATLSRTAPFACSHAPLPHTHRTCCLNRHRTCPLHTHRTCWLKGERGMRRQGGSCIGGGATRRLPCHPGPGCRPPARSPPSSSPPRLVARRRG
eukprot:1040789-Rhodomonas_salina.1